MQKNDDLQREVHDAIKWEPILNASEIGVSAKDGVVTLTGTVDSYSYRSRHSKRIYFNREFQKIIC